MVLADLTFPVDMHEGNRLWPYFEGLAAELGLSAPEALGQIADPWGEIRSGAAQNDPEAAEWRRSLLPRQPSRDAHAWASAKRWRLGEEFAPEPPQSAARRRRN